MMGSLGSANRDEGPWPSLPYTAWAPTKKTLHMASQMVGKVRLALAPARPEWLNSCLYLDARGLTTGAMPYGHTVVTIRIDVYDAAILIEVSDGRRATITLRPDGSVADLWGEFRSALDSLSIDVDLWDKPQEVVDPTPFAQNTTDGTFVAEHAQRFHRLLCALDGAFEEFRSPFFGRTGIQFWWGSFDYCVLLFTGKHVTAPQDRGYIIRYDLDAEHLNAGFWPGDDQVPEARLYAYIHPRPDGCEHAPIRPAPAAWSEAMGQWVLPYEDLRSTPDPQSAVVEFLQSAYQAAITIGRWDADAHAYVAPVKPRQGS